MGARERKAKEKELENTKIQEKEGGERFFMNTGAREGKAKENRLGKE